MPFKAITLILMFGMLLSCEAPPNRNNLNPMVRYMADTMFSHRRRDIDIKLDSICMLQMDSLRAVAIDSLLLIERKRINELSE